MNDSKKTKETFTKLIQSCLQEVKQEREQRKVLKESIKKYVKEVLSEIIANIPQDQDKGEQEKINKGFAKDGNEKLDQTQDEQVQQLTRIVHGINTEFNVYRDTTPSQNVGYTSGKRNFIIVDAGDLFTVRINERWENNYDIEAIIRGGDRVTAIGLNWEQVKNFVKSNFAEYNKTYVGKAKEKVDKNREDQTDKRDEDLPDTSIKTKKISNEPAKDGDEEAEDAVKNDEDQPSAPMKGVDVDKLKRQRDFTDKDNKVKPPARDSDKELVKKMPGKKRDKKD